MRATPLVMAWALLSTTGCHVALLGLIGGAKDADGPYEAGTIAAELGPAAVRTLACLDVGLALTDMRSDTRSDTLLEMHVGNRCIHAEPFDLAQLVMRGKDASGNERVVSLVDPRHEIVHLHVGALERGHERIRLSALDHLEQLCFELGSIAPDAPEARPLPLCLDRGLDGWHARSAT
jgi:hypothetical protein